MQHSSYKILTLFPDIFSGFLGETLIKKGLDKGLVSIETIQIRDFAEPPHYKVDEPPYGGGAGMVMKPEPIVLAAEKAKESLPQAKIILTSPSGTVFNQQKAIELSKEQELIFICGRYEGVDQRVVETIVDEEISIGSYIMMGGEVAVMAILEAILRLKPGFLGNPASTVEESFQAGDPEYLEFPQYTKPRDFRGLKVPEVLFSGNHQEISKWRGQQSIIRSKLKR